MRSVLPVVIAASFLAGCGSTAQNSDTGLIHTGLSRKTVTDDAPVDITETGPALSKEDQRVIGHSCKNKMWEPAPSRENAIALMKRQAAQRGYNAVHSVQVVSDPMALAKNCWSGLIASGIAFNKAATP